MLGDHFRVKLGDPFGAGHHFRVDFWEPFRIADHFWVNLGIILRVRIILGFGIISCRCTVYLFIFIHSPVFTLETSEVNNSFKHFVGSSEIKTYLTFRKKFPRLISAAKCMQLENSFCDF